MRTVSVSLVLGCMVLAAACAAPHGGLETDRLACVSCHAPIGSHESRDPPRSHECYVCHGTLDWTDAFIDHDSHYRISRGSHAGWTCTDCHRPGMSRSGRANLTCTNCHAHTEERTGLFHVGNGEYSYGPSTCAECHERGRD